MNIRSRLMLLVLLAVLGPALVVCARFVIDRGREVDEAVARLSAVGHDMANDLDEKIQGTAQLLYGLARARDLDTADRGACSKFLTEVREAYPQYTGILTINPDGQLFCDSLNTGRDLDLRDRDYFKRASVLQSGIVLEPAFGRLTGISVLQIVHPVRGPDGALRYLLVASLNLEKFLRDRPLRNTETLFLDKAGMVLSWMPAEARGKRAGSVIAEEPLFIFAKTNAGGGAGEVVGIDGAPQVWAAASTPELRAAGLHLLIGQNKDELVAEANRNLIAELGIVGAVALFLFCGVYLLAEIGVRRQVARIAQMAGSLGEGDLTARIPPPHPRGELGDLMVQLNGTAESLQRQKADIEDLSEKLHQSQKMEAVGQLTGGVAHDFNNLLTVILGNAELLVEKLAGHPELLSLAETMMRATERGASLTRSLLAFARRQPLEPRAVDVNALVLRMEGLLHRALGEQIECRFALGDGLWPALVDPAQLETALLNLTLNARDAMGGGGRLTVETANVHLDGEYAARHEDMRDGDYVMVAVADSGCGMGPEVIARAFEPFFTTKDVGKGTGLGLSMVYGFIKQSGGHVKIYSEIGHGTIVKLYLPRADVARDEAKAAQAPPPRAQGERILAVEDDEMVRSYVATELRKLGYEVTTARNGAEALDLLRGGAEVDLLFSDVVMPGGMSGPQLAEHAKRLRPGLKVLYTSGYTEHAVIHQGRIDPGVQLLNKPYRRQDLAAKLRAVLRGE